MTNKQIEDYICEQIPELLPINCKLGDTIYESRKKLNQLVSLIKELLKT